MQVAPDARPVVNVLTGFLGSGKTTLLRRLLGSPALTRCAVLVNELGEIPLDHELLERIDHETIVLRGGCVCCGVRTDMATALLRLNERRDLGAVPAFDRVIIETTGLADPVPVVNTLIVDPVLRHHYRVGTIVTTIDAVLGAAQLQRRREAAKQLAVADRIVITKADMASRRSLDELRAMVGGVNPLCPVIESHNDASEAEIQLTSDLAGAGRMHEVAGWFPGRLRKDSGLGARSLFGADGGAHEAHGRIRTLSLVHHEPLDWTAFGIWLSMLLHRHGGNILRLKGILNLQGVDVPTVVHGVQHLLHPPVHLAGWRGSERCSRLVLIGELPAAAELQQSLERFNAPCGFG